MFHYKKSQQEYNLYFVNKQKSLNFTYNISYSLAKFESLPLFSTLARFSRSTGTPQYVGGFTKYTLYVCDSTPFIPGEFFDVQFLILMQIYLEIERFSRYYLRVRINA